MNDREKVREAMHQVAKIAFNGGVRELANALGVSTQAAYKWVKEGVPIKRALQMSLMTKGQVQWYALAPEVLAELRAAMPKGEEA